MENILENAQRFLQNKAAYKMLQDYKENYKNWTEPEDDALQQLINDKKYVLVVGIGKEPFKARPFLDANKTLFWVKPRFKNKGYILNLPKYQSI